MITVPPKASQQVNAQSVCVELVEHNPNNTYGGISRYTREVNEYLSAHVATHLTTSIDPPFAHRLGFLHHLPRGVQGHKTGNIVHFMQLMGCAQMLWHPVHPSVATVHDLGPVACKADEPACHGFDRLLLDLQVAGLKRMDHLIAVSEFTRRGLIDIVGIAPEHISVIHHGIKHQVYRPIADAGATLTEGYPILARERHSHDLLYVGNELPRKNLAVLLDALASLKRRGYSVRLLKVGGAGGERWRKLFLEHVQKQQLEDDVVLFDNVPEADLPLFYNGADLFVTPSLLEGFGWPVLEAMACGTPVACSNAGSLPEIVGEAGVLFEAHDPTAVAEALADVLDDTNLQIQMRARGLERAQQFTWKRATDQLLDIYESSIS